MINNFEQIKSLLNFDSEDTFYHLQILKRKKEHPELGSNSYVVKTYYIKSIEHLKRVFPEIKNICDFHNARAYINLNKRSFERIAYHTLKKVTDCILNKDFKSVRKAYESVCGAFSTGDKLWIIDIDDNNFDSSNIIEYIDKQKPIGPKVVAKIPTKSGYHLIVKPFNASLFSMFEVDLHHNNPTILYIP